MICFAVRRFLTSVEFYLLIFAFVAFAFGVKSKKPSLRAMSWSLARTFSSRSFMVSGLTFKSSTHTELLFMCRVNSGPVSFFACDYLVFPTPFIEKTVFSPLHFLVSSVIH